MGKRLFANRAGSTAGESTTVLYSVDYVFRVHFATIVGGKCYMFFLVVLEIAISLSFLYLLLSLFTTTVVELIAAVLRLRARNLRKGIQVMLGSCATDVLNHPLITGLAGNRCAIVYHKHLKDKEGNSIIRQNWGWDLYFGPFPSYIPPNLFARVVYEIGKPQGRPDALLQILEPLGFNSQNPSLDDVKANLEQWYNDSMERVTGWYIRQTRYIALIVAFLVCWFMKADTIGITNELIQNAALRASVVEAASSYISDTDSTEEDPPQTIEDLSTRVDEVEENLLDTFPSLGWGDEGVPVYPCPIEKIKITCPHTWIIEEAENTSVFWGIVISTVAVTLGAPFWFDTLNRFISLRSSGAVSAQDKSNP